MIRTDVVELDFIGDGITRIFDVQIEGIPESPEGKDNFRVTVLTAIEGEVDKILVYGVDYRYETTFDARGFPISFRLELVAPVPVDQRLVVIRTTPILSISEYPDNGVPPRQVEMDFDHVIKILQELDFKTDKIRADLEKETEERKEADQEIWDELATKVSHSDPVKAHAEQHMEGGFDPLPPESIGAVRKAPATGKTYLATTSLSGTPGWVEFLATQGALSATTVVQTGFFATDGVSTEFSVTHTMDTMYVNATVYDEITNRIVYFPVTIPDNETVILHTENVLPANRQFRVLMFGPGKIDPAWLEGTYTHTQTTPQQRWTIVHDMNNNRPILLILDNAGNQLMGTPNYTTATNSTITVDFYEPVSGTATVYGWYEGDRDVVVHPKPFFFRQPTAQNTWTIRHDLNESRPTVLALDNNNEEMVPHIDYPSATPSTITLTFNESVSGTAIIGVR